MQKILILKYMWGPHRPQKRNVMTWKISKVCNKFSNITIPAALKGSTRTPHSPFRVNQCCILKACRLSGAHCLKSRGHDFSHKHSKVDFESFPRVYDTPTLSNIGLPYTVGKLLNSTFQWKCNLWETKGTRTCIRVHVMGATEYSPA